MVRPGQISLAKIVFDYDCPDYATSFTTAGYRLSLLNGCVIIMKSDVV